MAEVAGIPSVTNNGYRYLFCPLCGFCLKVKIYPIFTEGKTYQCRRCKANLDLEVVEEDEANDDGSFIVGVSAASSDKIKRKIRLREKKN